MKINKSKTPLKIKRFLKRSNISFNKIEALQNDASKRIYYRVLNKKENTIVMDSSAEKKSISNFIFLSNWLKKKNISVPEIFSYDLNKGILHIEDFGKKKFSEIFLNDKNNKLYYYKCAIKLLIRLSEIQPPKVIKHYNEKSLFKELNLFLEWHLKFNSEKNKKEVMEWNKLWKDLFKSIKYKKNCLVLRDFHIDNIFYLKKRHNVQKIGLIDYQDALIGHASYDLVSLLQDVRIHISMKDQKELFDYYIKSKKIDKKDFEIAYLILGTQRLFKIIGVFNRLNIKYNNSSYLKYLPRTWKILKKNLKNPIFSELCKWLKKNNFLQNE